MSRVLIVVANREDFPEPAFPVGALYVARAVEAAGGEARVFDAGGYRRPLPALRAELRAWRPDTVGLSLRNADNAAWPHTLTYTDWYARVAAAVRDGRAAGAASSSAARRSRSSRARCAALCSSPTASSATARWRRDCSSEGRLPGGIVERPLDDLADVGLPDDLGAVFPGAGRYRTAGVQTARGCPHRCVYCTYPGLEGTRLRRRPPEAVADEMERLRRELGATEQFVVDSSFNADEAHMTAVCEELRRRRSRPGAPLADVSFSCYLQPRVERLRRVPAAARGGVHLRGLRHRHRRRGAAPGPRQVVLDRATCARRRRRPRRPASTCATRCSSAAPARRRPRSPRRVRVTDEVAPTAVVAMVGLRIYPGTTARRAGPRGGPHRRASAAARAAVLRRRARSPATRRWRGCRGR